MNRSTPGLPVHHHLPEYTQTHVHQVSDAIQPSHPLLSPSPPAPNLSQHQSLFQRVNSSHEGQALAGVISASGIWSPLLPLLISRPLYSPSHSFLKSKTYLLVGKLKDSKDLLILFTQPDI